MAFSDSFWSLVIKSSALFEKVGILFSSAKFRGWASFMKWNSSFIKMLKSSGSRMDPYGTPESRIWDIMDLFCRTLSKE